MLVARHLADVLVVEPVLGFLVEVIQRLAGRLVDLDELARVHTSPRFVVRAERDFLSALVLDARSLPHQALQGREHVFHAAHLALPIVVEDRIFALARGVNREATVQLVVIGLVLLARQLGPVLNLPTLQTARACSPPTLHDSHLHLFDGEYFTSYACLRPHSR